MSIQTSKQNMMFPNSQPNNSFELCIATQPWEKQEVYKFRYEVYVEEMGKPLGSFALRTKMITDSLDDSSILLYARTGNEIVATVRTTIATAKEYPSDLSEVFQMHRFQNVISDPLKPRFGLGTKLAVKAQYRNTPVLYLIIAEAYRLLRQHNIQLCFTGCNPYLIPLYERLGFRRFAGNFTDPGYGLLVSLAMVVEDMQHFKAIQSPLYRTVRNYNNNLDNARLFLQSFPDTAKWFETFMSSYGNVWEYTVHKLGISLFRIPLFEHINEEVLKELLLSGVLFSCAEKDCIVYQGSFCNDLYILLSGALVAKSPNGTRILRPGEYIGNLEQPNRLRQVESISALTSCELLVIPRQSFERFQQLHPTTAETILLNLKDQQGLNLSPTTIKQGGQAHE